MLIIFSLLNIRSYMALEATSKKACVGEGLRGNKTFEVKGRRKVIKAVN
jgi:hypothetical protein